MGAASVADAQAENSANHDDTGDYTWDAAAVIPIMLNGSSISAAADGVSIDGSKATITAAATYSISGLLANGQVIVDTEDEETVRLILNGVDISSSTSAPINIVSAEKVIIVLADGTNNHLSDGETYVFEDPEEDEPNAALFSKSDLTIYGGGSLTVNGNYNDGIASKDGLFIASGSIFVSAVDDGIRGKDYLIVKDGNLTVNAQGDGLKSDNEEDASKGYIFVEAGAINITAGGDAVQAETDVMVTGGNITLSAGGGSGVAIDENTSTKGIKAAVNVNIDGGTFTINSADDAINSNGSLVVGNGTFAITSGDDGMHADATLDINGGDIQITQSYEGIESAVITINGGTIHIVSSDDGLNVAGGNDGSGMNPGWGQGGRPGRGVVPDQGNMGDQSDMEDRPFMPGQGGGPGMDRFAASGNYHMYINGGYIAIDANGDGIDSNGAVDMTDGIVLVNGPTGNMNGALDYLGSFTISGGLLVAAGSAGMAEAPSETSTQYSVLINFDTQFQAGDLVHIRTGDGKAVLTFSPSKQYQSIVLSSAELANGASYDVYVGGSSTGTVKDSLYQEGSYTAGTSYTSFTIGGIVTRIGGGNFRR
ncbi:MAG: carbohydrate-binding domain-containing protein [Anaerolineae bacterium]|nr:carbohydrate-binding domain-containing protein [Anaerolineae bacterium]